MTTLNPIETSPRDKAASSLKGGEGGRMAIGSDYSSPVTVNGFSCRNCTDVSYAAKRIDPAHPKSGPDGVNATSDPSQPQAAKAKLEQAKAARAGQDQAAQRYGAHGQPAGGLTPGRLIDSQA